MELLKLFSFRDKTFGDVSVNLHIRMNNILLYH